MASVHRQPASPFWYGAYSAGGKRYFRSTKTTDRKQAQGIARKWELAAKKAALGKLTIEAAREVIAQGVSEIFAETGHAGLPRATAREWAKLWLETKAIESEPSTHARYKGILERFVASLGPLGERDLEHVTSSHVEAFRNAEAQRLTPASANIGLKVLRAFFAAAVGKQLIARNPASPAFVKTLDRSGEGKRRPLTAVEIKRLYAKASPEWKGMILFGLYTGQRLWDIAHLTWRSLDLENDEIALTTKKTGRRIVLPLAKPVRQYIASLEAGDDPDAPLFPTAAAIKRVGSLSNRFRDLLVEVGLMPPVTRQKKGQQAKRTTSELSFHSLRHSAVTFLKAAGASDALAREIIGHESAAISRSYTHLATEDLRPAIDKLPDVTLPLSGKEQRK